MDMITNSKEVREYSDFEESLEINELCKYEKAYSDALEKGDSCKDCEFCISTSVSCIGGMTGASMGDKLYCEKHYWKEDV